MGLRAATVDPFLEPKRTRPIESHRLQPCIAHGINMRFGCDSNAGGRSGHWPLYRYRPAGDGRAHEEFVLDSVAPSIPLKAYAYNEIRYKMLSYTKPEEARQLLELAQEDVDQRWRIYTSLAERWPAASRRGQGEPGVAATPS